MKQLDFIDAFQRSVTGATRAAEHADSEVSDWTDHAAAAIRSHARLVNEPFIVEAISRDYPEPPPDKRAWGAAVRLAAARGWIKRIGYTTKGTSNACAKVLWISQERKP